MYEQKQLFIFDVDNTIAPSWEAPSPEMSDALCALLKRGHAIAFATARDVVTMNATVFNQLPCFTEYASHMYLLAASGAIFLTHKGDGWHEEYAERIPDAEVTQFETAYQSAFAEVFGDGVDHFSFHTREKDGLMISLFALDEHMPEGEKSNWDLDRSIRRKLVEIIAPQFKDLDVRIGGRTTIDVTKANVNKAYGITKLLEYTGIPHKEAIFIGDGFFEGGNDVDVRKMGIDIVEVENPEDTLAKLQMVVGDVKE